MFSAGKYNDVLTMFLQGATSRKQHILHIAEVYLVRLLTCWQDTAHAVSVCNQLSLDYPEGHAQCHVAYRCLNGHHALDGSKLARLQLAEGSCQMLHSWVH